MAFIYHFAGGDPETNQYLIDLPKLLMTETATEIDPEEDPCDCDDDNEDKDILLQDQSKTFLNLLHFIYWIAIVLKIIIFMQNKMAAAVRYEDVSK